VCTADVV
jgi:large subunit ribosomal protein L34